MPTKKGKSKPGKARKASNKGRRTRVGGTGQSRRATRKAGSSRKPGTAGKSGRARRATPGRRIGKPITAPPPITVPSEERGDTKAGGGESGRVVIL